MVQSNAFLYRMPAGIAGEINRAQNFTAESIQLVPTGSTNFPTAWGQAIVIDQQSGLGRLPLPTDGVANIYGILVRPYPGPALSQSDPLGPPNLGLWNPGGNVFGTVLRRGYMSAILGGTAAAVKAGPLFLRIAGASPTTNKIVGQFEAAADATAANTLGFGQPNNGWMGPADANGISELFFNL